MKRETVRKQLMTIQQERNELDAQINKLVARQRALQQKCTHPAIISAPTGKLCPDCELIT